MFLSQPVIPDVDVLSLLQPAGELLEGVGVVELQRAGLVLSLPPCQQLYEEDTDGGHQRGWAGGQQDPVNVVGWYLDLPPPLLSCPQGGGAGGSV